MNNILIYENNNIWKSINNLTNLTYNLYNLDYYLIPVSKIKELIRDNKYTYMNNSQINNGYIFKVDVIKKNSKKL